MDGEKTGEDRSDLGRRMWRTGQGRVSAEWDEWWKIETQYEATCDAIDSIDVATTIRFY